MTGFTLPDGDYGVPGSLARVLADVAAERVAQDAMWGWQEHPDGTGPERTAAADRAKRDLEEAKAGEGVTWRHILHEEVLEAFAEDDPEALRAELVQAAAVAVKWIQALDQRADPGPAAIDHSSRPADPGPIATGRSRPAEVAPSRPAAGDRFRAVVDVHVLLVRDGAVLLARRANTGYGDGRWHLPSGHLEEGENVTEAAIREAREEVGVTIAPERLVFAHVMHRAPDRVGLFFTVERWDGEPYNAEPHKCSEIGWWPLDGLPPDTIDYPAAAVRAIVAGRGLALHGWPQSGSLR
ncbi:ADP-ribose pyrophosphatase YjhB (NUDIX family) [Streptosporangium album]|uniref:ADP-ribose pyrophosphatase YjhB (NUDIX family) n=1 Tax=Streptosporangium album TaxID=47479 RepID=A0A7W7RZB8_9ACTN|nr:NUDIX domain-containing protein [Streptosporangium album]MBB4941001.1 ADP-ribose pyrophosphatase YjhB (NUDIX family) [Streptosporangium album]